MSNNEKTVDGKLVSYVHVQDERGTSAAFGPDDEVPEWAARKMGAHCFEGGVHPLGAEAEQDDDGDAAGPPPKAGRGSSAAAWADYAKAHDVDVPDDAGRDEIIAALQAADVPTE